MWKAYLRVLKGHFFTLGKCLEKQCTKVNVYISKAEIEKKRKTKTRIKK